MRERISHAKRIIWNGALIAAAVLAAGAGPAMAQPFPRPMPQPTPQVDAQDLFPNSSGGFLGVGITDITAEQAKELKLPSDYGAMVQQVEPNSPAAKAGLRKGDVVTDYNGMRVEGAAEFRRVVRETPPGHGAQITVWRDGHSEKLTAELGANTSSNGGAPPAPNAGQNAPNPGPPPFPNVAPNGTPNGRSFGPRFAPGQPPALYGRGGAAAAPALGVTAQNLTGQLGEYFGAPDGQGVLVTDVHAGSAGEKTGLKAGDVITKVNGMRVRNLGELLAQLASARNANESKGATLGVLRRGTEMSLDLAMDPPSGAPQNPAPGAGLDRRIPL